MILNIREVVDQELISSAEIVNRFPWEDPKAYGMWLAQTYYMVNHSTRLVALAGALAEIGNESLHARFIDHAKEERGHQLVCISDIKALGYNLDDFPQLTHSACMYQIQYYWIQYKGPTSFFGYTLALECLAEKFGPEVGQKIVKAHGNKATKFLALHAEADVGHVQEAYRAIDKLTTPQLEIAIENLRLSCSIYRSMLEGSAEFAFKSNQKLKAG